MARDGRESWTADLSLLSDDALEEVNRLWTITQVLSNTVHAVRNSLQVTGGNAELLENCEGLDPSILRRAQTIREHAARASDALESLLAYSRPAPESTKVVELGELARIALEMRAHSLGRARIAAELAGGDAGQCFTLARRRDLLQLLLNLLLGTEVMVAGWTGTRIVMTLARRGGNVRVEVTAAGTPPSAPLHTPAGEFGVELQRRVMTRLAADVGGGFEVGLTKEGVRMLALTLPAHDGAGRSPTP